MRANVKHKLFKSTGRLVLLLLASPLSGFANCEHGLYVWSKGLTAETDYSAGMTALAKRGVRDLYLISPDNLGVAARENLLSLQKETKVNVHAFVRRLKCHPGWKEKCNSGSWTEIATGMQAECLKRWKAGFRGCQIDLEPLPETEAEQKEYAEAIAKIRDAKVSPDQVLSVAAPLLETGLPLGKPEGANAAGPKPFVWSEESFVRLANAADRLMVMGYDLALPDHAAYANLMQAEAALLQKLPPSVAKKIQLGIPNFGTGRHGLHKSTIETPAAAYAGIARAWGKSCPAGAGIAVFHDRVNGKLADQMRAMGEPTAFPDSSGTPASGSHGR